MGYVLEMRALQNGGADTHRPRAAYEARAHTRARTRVSRDCTVLRASFNERASYALGIEVRASTRASTLARARLAARTRFVNTQAQLRTIVVGRESARALCSARTHR